MKTNIWYQGWVAQGGRCFKCASPIKINQSAKKGKSFNLLCQSCYEEPDYTFIVYDEFSEISDDVFRTQLFHSIYVTQRVTH